MPQVKIYSTPTCPYCIKAKNYLKEKNIAFVNIDVSSDEGGLREMMELTGSMGVPVIVIDGSAVIGFDKPKIDAKLGLG